MKLKILVSGLVFLVYSNLILNIMPTYLIIIFKTMTFYIIILIIVIIFSKLLLIRL